LIPRRYLCSHLVKLRCGADTLAVNLEEIWEAGAFVEADEPPISTGPAQLRCGSVTFCGSLERVERHAFGWRIEMSFSPLTPWSPERFEPDHMVDLSELG
jgi:hypothetical protein